MDTNVLSALKLFFVGIFVSTLMTSGLSATESISSRAAVRIRVDKCNDTTLLSEMEKCGEMFNSDMKLVDPQNWCNLTHFIREYNMFSSCTEESAVHIGCYWPNPLVERYIINIHQRFFSNCTLERVVWVDPPDDTLTLLILIPVFLTLAMIALVVWCSKRSDILA
ncbi:hypothetical protein AAFF_G00256120 [Aldrovandia affinis]|uniref:Receptor activity-modifying protein 3 n=1 Tax=Aldrovandia affinis TaxID=143900 RepID=A0AAD7RCG2_9TELE|nr:hypothetical protein AAFF_G00256120 [Aldrovandia affinis]